MNAHDIGALVKTGRVHRRVYADPEIFELEMERLFGRAWLFVGHESQVQAPGDFFTTYMGRQPVVVVRHEDGAVHVLNNRCGHRGTQVVGESSGNATNFTCCYHGWKYRTDGSLHAVPLRQGYSQEIDLDDPAFGMVRVPRTDSYRGFIFASLAEDGPGLRDFLGHMTTSFDDMVDRAPDGELEVAGGIFKHTYDGNWKLVLENWCDGLHPNFVHISSVDTARGQSEDVHTDGSGEIARRQMLQNGASLDFWENNCGLWVFPRGHCYIGDYHDDEKLVATKNDPDFREYIDLLENRNGAERTKEILKVGRWNSNIYPNCSFMSQFRSLRIIHPIAPDRTQINVLMFKLKGAPEKMFLDTVRFANVTNGTGSVVLTDDLETYARISGGMASQGSDWIEISRAMEQDQPYEHGGSHSPNGTSEIHIRNMFSAWRDYMTDGGANA